MSKMLEMTIDELMRKESAQMRTFATGATRDVDTDKLDYEGFESPLVMQSYAKYMHKHRIQPDGKLRDSDNWQKGIPQDAYMKSLWRHFMDLWLHHRGYMHMAEDKDLESVLNAILFNVKGYLFEHLKGKVAPPMIIAKEYAVVNPSPKAADGSMACC